MTDGVGLKQTCSFSITSNLDLGEKNDLAQNAKELESEKVELASSKELKVQIKRLNGKKQESEAKLSTKAQENDDGYNSGINTPITSSGSLSPTSTLSRSVKHLELYEENQKATPKGQKKRFHHYQVLAQRLQNQKMIYHSNCAPMTQCFLEQEKKYERCCVIKI